MGEGKIHRGVPADCGGGRQDPRTARRRGAFSRSGRGGFDCGYRGRVHGAGTSWQAARAFGRRGGWTRDGSIARMADFRFPRRPRWKSWRRAAAPITQCDEPHELVTPTGAALLAEFVEKFGPMENFVPQRIGFGVGKRDNKTRPNVLRADSWRDGGRPRRTIGKPTRLPSWKPTWTTSTRSCWDILSNWQWARARWMSHTPGANEKEPARRFAERPVRAGTGGQVLRDDFARDQRLRRAAYDWRSAANCAANS